jgi:hypothetical protein
MANNPMFPGGFMPPSGVAGFPPRPPQQPGNPGMPQMPFGGQFAGGQPPGQGGWRPNGSVWGGQLRQNPNQFFDQFLSGHPQFLQNHPDFLQNHPRIADAYSAYQAGGSTGASPPPPSGGFGGAQGLPGPGGGFMGGQGGGFGGGPAPTGQHPINNPTSTGLGMGVMPMNPAAGGPTPMPPQGQFGGGSGFNPPPMGGGNTGIVPPSISPQHQQMAGALMQRQLPPRPLGG